MGYAERRKGGYRARFKDLSGHWPTIVDAYGKAVLYPTKREAVTAANDREAELRRDPARGKPADEITLETWVNRWWPGQDLEPTTRENYAYLIQYLVLPEYGERRLSSLTHEEISAWERRLVADGYAESTAHGARSRLVTILGDAQHAGLIPSNPAARRRGRGRKAARRERARAQGEKAWATSAEVLLLAERAALLSGRAADFLLPITAAYCCLRWGETLAVRRDRLRGGRLDVDEQLRELGDGKHRLAAPKDGSVRTIDLPPFLRDLLEAHAAAARGCSCHPGAGFLFLGPDGGHPRRSNYARRVFTPAAEGRYPPDHGVRRPVYADVELGVPLRATSGKAARLLPETAPSCWAPLVRDLTPHSLRHSGKTWMVEDGIPEILSAERMGHTLGDISSRYTHVTDAMRQVLLDALTTRWHSSLKERAERFGPHSAVPMLDALLAPYRGETPEIISPASPRREVGTLSARRRKTA